MKKTLALILFSIPILLSSCLSKGNPNTTRPPCSIDTLLISEDFLPEGIFYETGTRSAYDPPAKVGIEKTGTSFSSENSGGLIHHVYRFSTEKEAQTEIEQIISYAFEDTNNIDWFTPPINLHINADEYKLGCMQLPYANGVRCRLVTRYKVYVSDIDIDLIEFNYEDLSSIVGELNERMVSCFES